MRTIGTKKELKLSLMLLGGVSALAIAQPALAQDDDEDEGGNSALTEDVVIVKGIRRSLEASSEIKRNSQGVVDAITADDIGKFPDTNLAESLQRITGVSINRSLGEGSQVTVRGFGPDFNLVLLNGRQMPSAFLEGGAPSSRSFDFGNLASEGIAGVTVYKTGRAAIPTGGVGSTLNILTARPLDAPGMRFSLGAKAVLDTSNTTLSDREITPEVSGIFSNTFADGKIGVSLAGSYQDRNSGLAQFGTTSGWRGAFLGSENNWGTLPQAPGDTQVTNRPGPDDIYSTPQNLNYQLANFNRERINGQIALQFRPVDNLTATLDYFYTRREVSAEKHDLSVWFNHGDTTSAWTDGPIASPIFYNENFGDGGSDLSMGSSLDGSKSENKSFGANVEWDATENLSLGVDFHMSSAESGQNSPFGTAGVVSTADFQLRSQGANFENELPVLSLGFQSPFTDIDPSRMVATGSTFQNSLIRTEIDQVQVFGSYNFDSSIISSVDFGASYTENRVRSAFANNQTDSWGGVGTADDLPDDIFRRVNLASNFDAFEGHELTQQDFLVYDANAWIAAVDALDNRCGGDGICRSDDFSVDRRIVEESWAGFLEVQSDFYLGSAPAQIIAGVRYETTNVVSPSQINAPTGTQWVAENELALIGLNDPANSVVQEFTGQYDYFLPAADFQVDPIEDVKLRVSYSHTLTRPGYADIAGGLSVNQLFRVDGGTGQNGNTNLRPFLSKNIDVSAEWYYDDGSYLSAGFFYKDVKNFIGAGVVTQTPFDLFTPIGGARFQAGDAATGGMGDLAAIRQWIFNNADPSTFEITGTDASGDFTGNIFGVPGEDPQLTFNISTPVNQESASIHGWEFALQHLFGETGFGFIGNYTIVDGDVGFDNFQVPSSGDPQFALLGLSDSYNLIGFYDKDGLQARVAWNKRGQFLSSTIGVSGTPNNPLYVEGFGQLDFNASYEVHDGLTLFVEGINVLNATSRTIGRTPGYVNFAVQTGPRYNFGARYSF